LWNRFELLTLIHNKYSSTDFCLVFIWISNKNLFLTNEALQSPIDVYIIKGKKMKKKKNLNIWWWWIKKFHIIIRVNLYSRLFIFLLYSFPFGLFFRLLLVHIHLSHHFLSVAAAGSFKHVRYTCFSCFPPQIHASALRIPEEITQSFLLNMYTKNEN